MRNASVDFVHSNSEIIRFDKDYKLIIFKACKDAGLRRCDWEHIENEILIKFSMGRIEYDPTYGIKASAYYYIIAKNAASDERKKQHFVELDDKEMEYVPDEHNPFVNIEAKDNYFVVTEALKRLVKKCRDKKKIKILRYLILRYLIQRYLIMIIKSLKNVYPLNSFAKF